MLIQVPRVQQCSRQLQVSARSALALCFVLLVLTQSRAAALRLKSFGDVVCFHQSQQMKPDSS